MYTGGKIEEWSHKNLQLKKGKLNTLMKKQHSLSKNNIIKVLSKQDLGYAISTNSSVVEKKLNIFPSSEDDDDDDDDYESYHNQIKPLFLILATFGSLPIKMKISGNNLFNVQLHS